MKDFFRVSLTLILISYAQCNLVEFDENNWSLMLKGEWMVEFFAPWCPACKNLAPVWERFAGTTANHNVKVAKIDVTTSPSLSGRFFVTALPTIYHVINGEFRQYRGSRDLDALTTFVQKKDWKKIEPISAWKKPDTLHMTVLSYFFKLSHVLKEFNGRLQEEYGLPSWGSYALFAVGTILVGAILGLMLVCVVDFLFPPKKNSRQSFSETKENAGDGIEDLARDEIEDDGSREQNNANNKEESENDEDVSAAEEQDESEEENAKDEKESTTSESDQPESDKNITKTADSQQKVSPAEVRKRKSRKAD